MHMSMNSELLQLGSGVFYLQHHKRACARHRCWSIVPFGMCGNQCVEQCGHSQLYPDCPLDVLTFPISRVEPFRGRESRGPISNTRIWPLCKGVGICNDQHPAYEVFGVEKVVVACKPFRPCVPIYFPKGGRLHQNVSSSCRHGARGVFREPSSRLGQKCVIQQWRHRPSRTE